MLESAELGHEVDKESYQREVISLREALLTAQYQLKEQGNFAVVVLIAGLDGAGKSETVHALNEWMDPRLNQTRAFARASKLEQERPRMWRYWQVLPPKGRIGLLFGAWYGTSRSPRKTGATATSGAPTPTPSTTWSRELARSLLPGRWWRLKTSTPRASKCYVLWRRPWNVRFDRPHQATEFGFLDVAIVAMANR